MGAELGQDLGDQPRVADQGAVGPLLAAAQSGKRPGRGCDPGDVEWVLTSHLAVADAGVVQILEKGGGEAVAAVVVPLAGSKVTEQEVLAFGRERLAAHQAPASVTFVGHLPRNSVGKLLRDQLRALASPKTRPDTMHLILKP